MAATITRHSLGIFGNALEVGVKIVFVLFTLFYLFLDGPRMLEGLRKLLPLDQEQADVVFRRNLEVIDASVYGVLVIAVVQGTLGGVAFWMAGVPSPVLWGVVMIVLSMIPVAGAFVVWLPVAIFYAVIGQWGKAAFLTVWGAVVIGTVDNFMRPQLVGRRARLHDLAIFFSVLGGLQVFGVLGLVLGPVVLAVTLALFDCLHLRTHDGEGTSAAAKGPEVSEPPPEPATQPVGPGAAG
jgi:predicted PurR-regulated permease PerM